MNEKKSCPCCGHKKIVRDVRTKEVYCNHCGLIFDDKPFVEEDQTFQTSHEPLSDGLSLKAEMAKKERANNYKSSSKNKYDKLKSRYFYGILQDELLDRGYCLSEALDIFNYCFVQYYIFDTNWNESRKPQKKLVDDFFNSLRFEKFDVSATVSRLKIPNPLRSSWLP